MVFPNWGLVDCLMSLDIGEWSVTWLAMTLFNAKVEWVNGVLQIVHGDITMATTNSELTLKGAFAENKVLRHINAGYEQVVTFSSTQKLTETFRRAVYLLSAAKGLANIGRQYYLLFIIVPTVCLPVVYLFYPETARLSLEEIGKLFCDDTIVNHEADMRTTAAVKHLDIELAEHDKTQTANDVSVVEGEK